MILIPFACLIVGVLLGIVLGAPIDRVTGLYLGVASLAGLDSLCGGIRASLEKKFHTDVFVSGFVFNCLIAFGLAWIGDRIDVDIFLVCSFIFGVRIFNNLSLIRRFWLTQLQDSRELRRKNEAQSSGSSAMANQADAN
ncbi:MAG: small basic family protein [Chthonomonas sp.]|nr:small basic family protein [Chthonomonas sp.]